MMLSFSSLTFCFKVSDSHSVDADAGGEVPDWNNVDQEPPFLMPEN